MKAFADVTGTINKVFKGYDTGKKVFEVSTSSSDGLKFTAKATQGADLDGNITLSKDNTVGKGVALNFTVDLTTKGEVKLTQKVNEVYPGLKLGVSAGFNTANPEADKTKKEKLNLTAEYIKPKYRANAGAEYQDTNYCKGVFGFTTGADNFYVGGDVTANVELGSNKRTTKYNVGVAYAVSTYTIALELQDNLNKAVVGFANKIGKTTVAGQYTHIAAKKPEFAAGLSHQLDSDTTIKAMINQDGQIGLAYNGVLNKDFKFGVATKLNAADFSKNFQLGTSLSFS